MARDSALKLSCSFLDVSNSVVEMLLLANRILKYGTCTEGFSCALLFFKKKKKEFMYSLDYVT